MEWNRIIIIDECTCSFNTQDTVKSIIHILQCIPFINVWAQLTNYRHFKFVLINHTKIKTYLLFGQKRFAQTCTNDSVNIYWFIHYMSITCRNLCGNIGTVHAATSCNNVETLRWKTGLSHFKSLLVTLVCDIQL